MLTYDAGEMVKQWEISFDLLETFFFWENHLYNVTAETLKRRKNWLWLKTIEFYQRPTRVILYCEH